MSFIEVQHLRKEYPNVVPLKDVNATIERGEVISIIGPSGTGKSTFLRCLNRLETPTSGRILIDGIDMCDPATDLSAMRRKVGMVFQSFNLFGHMLVAENVMYGPTKLLGMGRQEAYDEALRLLGKVGLKDKALSFPHELSGGQKQRVAIARGLAMHPEVLLFDEPTSALDPTMESEVLAHEGSCSGGPYHARGHARNELCPQCVQPRVLYGSGRKWETGPPEQIFEHPQRPETYGFVYRVRSWEWELTYPDNDNPAMEGSLSEFCARQFVGRKLTNACQHVVEELSVVRLASVAREKGISGTIAVLRLYVGEGGEKALLEVDCHSLKERGVDPHALELERDLMSDAIIDNYGKRVQSDDPDVIVYEIG